MIIHASNLEKLADSSLFCNALAKGVRHLLRQVFVVVGPLQHRKRVPVCLISIFLKQSLQKSYL